MASARARETKIVHFISRFNAILAVTTILTVLVAPSAQGQGTGTASISKFAYVAGNNIVAGYTIDSVTGALTEISGSPFATGTWARSVAADPQGHFLYVANWMSANVSGYTIDGTTGSLTEMPGSPFASADHPAALTVDPTGHFVYVANQYSDDISAYTVDSATGALTQIAGSPFAAGYNPVGLAVAPSGKSLYVAEFSGWVSAYAIDAASGKLSEITGSPFFAGSGAFQVAIPPSGEFAYVAVQNYNAVAAYSIDSSSGALTPVPGSPFSAGQGPYYVAVDPSGRFVYTANFFSDNVSGYTINPENGALTQIAGSPFPAGHYPGGITTDLSGKFVYAANWGSGSTSGFTIDPSTGALSPMPGSPFLAETGVISVTTVGSSGPQSPTSTTLASSFNSSVYGQSVVFTATVTSDAGTPIGAVQILNGSVVVGSGNLVNGSAAIAVSTLPTGIDSVTASYLGGGGFASSRSAPLSQTVIQAATTTLLTSSLNPAATNQSITFTATVTSQYGGAAIGTVAFLAGSQSLGSASLSGNVATLTTSFATAGTYTISAQYSGDGNNIGSTSTILSEKILASTTTAVTSSLNPSSVGQVVTFTATVSSSGGIPPNGEVITFYNGTAVLGTAGLSGGTAALTTSSLPAGVFTIKASYAGDTTFAGSTSPVLKQVVNSTTKSATSSTLASSLNPSIYGQQIVFTATVTTTGPVSATGTVAFNWGDGYRTYTIGSATLNGSGVATLVKSNLNADPYPLTAVYKGDVNNLGSTSTVLNQVVQQTTSTARITSSLNPSILGQAVTFTATITSPTVVPTGPVTFKAGTTVLGTAQLSGGKASFTTSSLPAGSTVVKATYNGDSNIHGSSWTVTQVVQQ